MKFNLLLAGLLACNSLFAQTNPNPSTSVDQLIASEMALDNTPGLATIMVKDGKIIWFENYGLADVANNTAVDNETVFMLASVSKLFTGTIVMYAHEQGLINIDRDINTYLPFDIEIPGQEADSITCRDLLTHTASIKDSDATDVYYDNPDPSITLADCMARYFQIGGQEYHATNNFATTAPGTVYEYSNMATALVAYVVESASGMLFSEYSELYVFDALCMENTHWHFNDYADSSNIAIPHSYSGGSHSAIAHYGFADYPNGQLRSNIFDLAKFAAMYLDNGMADAQLLTAATIDDMWTVQNPGLDQTQGLSWYTETITGGGEVWSHNGGEEGVTTDIYLDIDNNIGIVILANISDGYHVEIADALHEHAMTISAGDDVIFCGQTPNSIETEISSDINVFPTPSTGKINFQVPENSQITITNMLGVNVVNATASGQTTFDLSDKARGIYLYQINNSSGKTTGKFNIH